MDVIAQPRAVARRAVNLIGFESGEVSRPGLEVASIIPFNVYSPRMAGL